VAAESRKNQKNQQNRGYPWRVAGSSEYLPEFPVYQSRA
jgi:hypothetical protein